jgi:uncharacterized protein YjfI (DUF2170 family)
VFRQDGSEVEPALEGGLEVQLFLLDIQMKEMNGDVLCSRLRAKGDLRVMIAVTGRCMVVGVALTPLASTCGTMRWVVNLAVAPPSPNTHDATHHQATAP